MNKTYLFSGTEWWLILIPTWIQHWDRAICLISLKPPFIFLEKQEISMLSAVFILQSWGVGGRVVGTSYIWHSADVHAEGPLFQRCQVYDLPPFSTKSIRQLISGFVCERPNFSDILVYAYIFRSEIFRRCLFSGYSMNWLRYLSVKLPAINGLKIKRQYMNRSIFWTIKYMNGFIFSKGQVYEWVRFWNTGSHTHIVNYAPAPKLPLPPPYPPTEW